MPAPRSRRRATFPEIKAAIVACEQGQERNLYPYVRDLFINVLGYRPGDLLVDTADEIGGIPDLAVLAPNGLTDTAGAALTTRWLVVEVKDEPGVFAQPASRERIFREKAKYIGLDTAWFVLIDPECFVLRPVTSRAATCNPARDTVLLWHGLTEEAFRDACREIHAENSATNPRLEAFRRGEEAHIAEVKLTRPGAEDAALAESRAEFYAALRTSAELIKLASHRALETFAAQARTVRAQFDAFFAEFGRAEFHLDPFRLAGQPERIPNREAFNRHRDAIHALRRLVRRHPAAARLGCFTLPEYEARALGDSAEEKARNAVALLASETASLLVARCIMLRFFEDHGFFGGRRYLCNGGVAAFQTWRAHFHSSYTWFLRESFGEAARLAAALFEEGDLDWVLTCADPQLSTAIERALFYLSRFDFSTVEQDVLSGVYGQFLDNTQRKLYGEHYTPPEVARFIVRHLPVRPGDRVLDPACGLGTFLIEVWKALIGDAAARGAATWEEALAALDNVRGNDLNSFSATIAQVQLLWHLFGFREQLQRDGLPEPTITGGHDSLHAPHQGGELGLAGELNEFSLLDTTGYGAVVGNPPYVVPARQSVALAPSAAAYFDEEYSARSNLCGLFLFKALDYWLRPPNGEPATPGRLGFVIPLSMADNDDSAKLRAFFRPGTGRWTVREIVDLELISPRLFGADVVCMILLAERRAPRPGETVRLRVADERCALFTEGETAHVRFDLEAAPVTELPYADLFSADGRWLTRLTSARKAILDRFAGATFADLALRYWVGKNKRGKIVQWSLTPPAAPGDLRWEEETMIRMGAAFRGEKHFAASGGLPVFKGEHVAACKIEGEPVEVGIDVARMDDPSVWRLADILPARGYAFHRIAPALYCAPFDPRELVLLNTTSLFFPAAPYAEFPFDILVLSRIYQFVWAIGHREGVLFRARANVYVTTLARLPWTEALLAAAAELRALRTRFLAACQQLHQREEVLREHLTAFDATTVRACLQADPALRVDWSPALQSNEQCEPGDPQLTALEGQWRVQPGDDLDHFAHFNDAALAAAFAEGLRLHPETGFRLARLLDLPIPAPDQVAAWRAEAARLSADGGATEIEAVLDAVDAIVATAYGLPQAEVEAIWREFQTDPMLRRVQPNLPFAHRRRLGLRTGLTESDRFTRVYRTRSQAW